MGQLARDDDNGRAPALLLFLLKAKRCTVGELIDFANGLPREWVSDLAATLSSAIADEDDPRCRRRKLVLLGALLNRVIFDVEGVAKSRDAPI